MSRFCWLAILICVAICCFSCDGCEGPPSARYCEKYVDNWIDVRIKDSVVFVKPGKWPFKSSCYLSEVNGHPICVCSVAFDITKGFGLEK